MLQVDLCVERGAQNLAATFAAPIPGVTALFGASGAGKSTLVHAIAGLLRPTRGRIALGSRVFLDTSRGINVPAERRRLGAVFQEPRLFPHLSVLANLRYGLQRAPSAGRFVTLDEAVALLGLDALLGRRTRALSGGEKSRVALGRALLAQPELLLLDEPLAGLDAPRREEVLPYLERLRDRSLPIVYVSHQYEEVLRLATHLVLLERGRVLATGSPAELSLGAELRGLVGAEAVGSVLDAPVRSFEPHEGIATVLVAGHALAVPAALPHGTTRLRVHIPARDVFLALKPTAGLSVRNQLPGFVLELAAEPPGSVLVTVGVGTTRLLARVTRAAASELQLRPGLAVQALIKAESLRGHSYAAHVRPQPAGAP
jgi:molybdate transport system ATP-binding protein